MSKISLIFLVLVIVLAIGIIVPKITTRDAVALTDWERTCTQANFSVLYDHPFQRIGADWLGNIVVTKKKDEILYVTGYTLFRIPVATIIVNCETGVASSISHPKKGAQMIMDGTKL